MMTATDSKCRRWSAFQPRRLSDSESMLVDTQARDPRFEGLPRNAESGRRAGGPRNAAVCRSEGRFDRLPVPVDEACLLGAGRGGLAFTNEPGLVDAERSAVGKDHGPLDDVLELSDVAGPAIGL